MISFYKPKASSVFIILKFSVIFLAGDVSNIVSAAQTGDPQHVNEYGYISPVGLKSLFTLERTLYNSLSQYAAALKDSSLSKQLQPYLVDYEETTLKFINDIHKDDKKSIENLSWNPILAFRTVWRFVKFLRRWAEPGVNMPKNQASKFKDISLLLARHYNVSNGPTSSDLEDAKMGLIRIVDTFSMDIQHFAAGNISGKDYGVGLSAAQCIEIGWFAIKHGLYVTSVEFMEAALDKVEQQTGDKSVKISKARENVQAAYKEHDRGSSGKDTSEWDTDFFTKDLEEVSARTERVRKSDNVSRSHERKMYDEGLNPKHRFQAVCKGTYRQSKKATSKLFCWYEHQVDPTFKIGPLKAEFVAPQTVKFHRVISEAAISQLKKNMSTFSDLRISRERIEPKEFSHRLGAYTFLHPSQSSTARLIADLTGRATGFQYNERNFETMFIIAYTPGAFMYCHPDLVHPKAETYKSRIATFEVYLSDVEQGGGTGLCEHGVVVEPEVGSALLRFNMLSSGVRDVTYNHCSCPVVYGEKWVASAWIYMGPQSHVQCDPDPSKKLEYLVNKK